MSRELSIDKIFKNNERVVFKYGDLYPGSLLSVLRNSFTGKGIINYPDIWVNLLNKLCQKFEPMNECLIFLSPLHTTTLSSHSVDEEWAELKVRNAGNKIFMEGKVGDRKYLCFDVKRNDYLEDLIYRFYDSGIKLFLKKEALTMEQVVAALSHIRFEEGECSTDVFNLIMEIDYPSGKECFITAEAEKESLIKETLEEFSQLG